MLNQQEDLYYLFVCKIHNYQTTCQQSYLQVRTATNESQKTRNKNQETKQFSTFAVSRLCHSETKKTLLDSRIKFSAKHV